MSSIRIAYGSLHHHGAGLLPDDLEGVDYLLLDGGPVVAPGEEGPDELLDEAVRRLAPMLYLNPKLNVIASLAGRAPEAAARRVSAILSETGNADLPIGVVYGSDVLDRLEEFMAAGEELRNLHTGSRFAENTREIVTSAVLLDDGPLTAVLNLNPRLVLAGNTDRDAIRFSLGLTVQPNDPRRPVEIVCRCGFVASALLQASGDSAWLVTHKAVSDWRAALRRASLDEASTAIERHNAVDAGDAFVTTVVSQHEKESSAETAMRLLQQIVATEESDSLSFHSAFPPSINVNYETWPTSIPTDLVEWSVDVRPAKGWVE